MTDSFADAEGNVVPASTYGLLGDWSEENVITVTLEERDGGTRVTVRSENIPEEMRGRAKWGCTGPSRSSPGISRRPGGGRRARTTGPGGIWRKSVYTPASPRGVSGG